jgi:hypothetical protein
VTIFGQNQVRISNRTLGKGVQLSKINPQRLLEICQATHALRQYCRPHFHLNKQSLGSTSNPCSTAEVHQIQIGWQMDLLNLYTKVPVVPDGLVNNKTDIQPEGR